MKTHVLLLILSCLLFLSCEDVIDVDVPTTEPQLVVDAYIRTGLSENGRAFVEENEIKLTLSAPFFDGQVPLVTDALVTITDETGNIFVYEDINNDGIYMPDLPFNAVDLGETYTLTIEYDGEVYTATAQLMPSVPIDNIEQGDGTLFDGDEIEIILSFTDDGARDDYYLFDFDFGEFLTSEDRFYQGNEFSFSYFYEDMPVGQEVTISILGIDEQFYNYMNILLDQSDDTDGPFATPPATARGNIVNTTDQDNFALGYFAISESDSQQFTIQERN